MLSLISKRVFFWLLLPRWELTCQTQSSLSSRHHHLGLEQSLLAFLDWWDYLWIGWSLESSIIINLLTLHALWDCAPPSSSKSSSTSSLSSSSSSSLSSWPVLATKVGGYKPTPVDRRSPLGWHRFLEVGIKFWGRYCDSIKLIASFCVANILDEGCEAYLSRFVPMLGVPSCSSSSS